MRTRLIYDQSMLLLALLLLAPPDVFVEKDGQIAIEAENYHAQERDEIRKWHRKEEPAASGGAFLHILPDTRVTHADKLIHGQNFSNKPGVLAILSYKVRFTTPGRYYVWVRAFSTGAEDNSIHVGLNGEWPESGQRIQFCEGKRQWWWESRQRTQEQHCGVPGMIYLDIPAPGEHTIQFSMREDGFRFDQFLLTTTPNLPRPSGAK
jgi:hypothetical protein